MNSFTRRIATGFALIAAPALIAVGGAAASHATATAAITNGPTATQSAVMHQGHGSQAAAASVSHRRHHGYYHRRG